LVWVVGSFRPWLGGASTLGADGIGTQANFNNPAGVATDGINLYVVDASNQTIRKVVIATGETSTLAGKAQLSGTSDGIGDAARFNQLGGITTDGTNLYVADGGNNKIRKIVIATGEVTTFAGSGVDGDADGTGTGALLSSPSDVTTDGTFLYERGIGALHFPQDRDRNADRDNHGSRRL
jgi:DNA-binding beta-propeller fold protein YncE